MFNAVRTDTAAPSRLISVHVSFTANKSACFDSRI